MTTEELQTLLDAATPGPWSFEGGSILSSVSSEFNEYTGVVYLTLHDHEANAHAIATWPTIAAELIAARAKLAAAERLAEAVRNIDESCLISDPEELGDMARAALTAWEAVK